ncbi:MAG: NAD(P)H-dependent glycerol-3-phosphate dehydrogenase [Verrucomicrobiota bacterium]|nr:NAD(P)H-dependent glycerol-3-phosphate dehydrogenase [Verrucomicrobiota bacterium]
MNITVLGPGAWGTALAKLAHEGGHAITLWGRKERLAKIAYNHQNTDYLPDIELPTNWTLEPDIQKALSQAEGIILAIPSRSFREAARELEGFKKIAVSVTKGIEHETGLTMAGILEEITPQASIVALSGPSLAIEVAKGIPTGLVCASTDANAAKTVQSWFHRPPLRTYTSSDVHGVELGGALKNVIAIAAGVCDGLNMGDNAKAALITRGLNEMKRLGTAAGALPETFFGLSGMGDLTVTCFSKQSRNRTLGERIAKGEALRDVLADATAEGYPTTKSAKALAGNLEVNTPIIDEVYAMLYEGKDVKQAVIDLTTRDPRAET